MFIVIFRFEYFVALFVFPTDRFNRKFPNTPAQPHLTRPGAIRSIEESRYDTDSSR